MRVKDGEVAVFVYKQPDGVYEDFIEGFRPTESGGFEIKKGAFYKFCKKASSDKGNEYFFIIDEIKKGGGRFIITSDCHYRERMTVGFDVAEKLLTVHGLRKNPDGELNNIVRGIDIWE